MTAIFKALALYPGERDALDERLLRQEEDDDHGRHHEERGRHRQVPLHLVERAELRQADLEHPAARVFACVQERQEKVVEGEQERKERTRGDRGFREPKDNGAEDAQLAATVDT